LSNSPNPSIPSGPPYYPYGQGSGQLVGSQGNGVDIGTVLATIAAKLTAIAAKVGA
jgi:hypothetical protein